MSWYNTVILSFNCNEYEDAEDETNQDCAQLRRVNAWLKRRHYTPLWNLNSIHSGHLGSNAVLFGGCYNYLDVDGFCRAVRRQRWQDPQDVQIIFWGDNDERFTVLGVRGNKEHLKVWWQPVLKMQFDDPEQEPPFWVGSNNVVMNTPFPGIQIKAYAMVNSSESGVFISGTRRKNLLLIQQYVKREIRALRDELPEGAEVSSDDYSVIIERHDLETDNEKRAWLTKTLNEFANVLRPRLRKWYSETRRKSDE